MTTATAPATAPAPAPTAAAPAPAAPAAPAPAPATTDPAPAAPAAAPATAPSPAPALAFESLIHDTPAPAPAPGTDPAAAPAPAAADPLAELATKLPEKFQVKAGDGKLDTAASLAKALEHRDHLERRLGAGDLPPKSAAEYSFEPPAELKDFELTSDRFNEFKTEAYKAGFTQAQFQLAMKAYLGAVPDLMAGAAKLSANEARAELQKVWPVTADFEKNLDVATRAMRLLPADLQEATRAYGTDPVFLRVLQHFGAQTVEGTSPAAAGQSAGANQSVQQLMASDAYLNPKNPDHQRVSEQVRKHFASAYGTTAI